MTRIAKLYPMGMALAIGSLLAETALALPPPDDLPEEVLRTEIITEARSPIDGKPMTAEAYAELQAQMEAAARRPPEVDPEIRELVGLLRLRRAIRSVFPFLLR